MILQGGQPLANDHAEGLASCKWSARGGGLLRIIIHSGPPLANDHLSPPSPSSPMQGFRFNLAELSRTIWSGSFCLAVCHLASNFLLFHLQKNISLTLIILFAILYINWEKSGSTKEFVICKKFRINKIWQFLDIFSCNKFWINNQCCNFQKLRIKTNFIFCKMSTWPSFSSSPSISVNSEQFWKTSKLLDFPDCLCLPPLSTMQRTRFKSHP